MRSDGQKIKGAGVDLCCDSVKFIRVKFVNAKCSWMDGLCEDTEDGESARRLDRG